MQGRNEVECSNPRLSYNDASNVGASVPGVDSRSLLSPIPAARFPLVHPTG